MSPDQIKDLANSIISSAALQPPVEGLREAAPLAWNEYIREGVADEWDAETAFGTFYSVQTGTFNFMPYYDNTAIQNGGSESPEEAKAVCQADYSRRLLAALSSWEAGQ